MLIPYAGTPPRETVLSLSAVPTDRYIPSRRANKNNSYTKTAPSFPPARIYCIYTLQIHSQDPHTLTSFVHHQVVATVLLTVMEMLMTVMWYYSRKTLADGIAPPVQEERSVSINKS